MRASRRTPVIVFSWNIGRPGDFSALCARAGLQLEKEELELKRAKLLADIVNCAVSASVELMCFQEVDETVHLQRLLGDGFECFGLDGDDCVVAWSKQRYQLCSSWTSHHWHAVGVKLFDTKTNTKVRLCSAHLYEFNLAHPTPGDSADGDNMLKYILKKVHNVFGTVICGMDTNDTSRDTGRCSQFAKKGFLCDLKDIGYTAFNKDLPEQRAQIDFIFAKNASVEEATFPDIVLESPNNNPSDHRPVIKSIMY